MTHDRKGRLMLVMVLSQILVFVGCVTLAQSLKWGDVIAYVTASAEGTKIHVVDVRTRLKVSVVTQDNPLAPAWSPDGCQIAYHTRSDRAPGQLRLTSLFTRHSRTLLDQSAGSVGPSQPDWSPDGSRLVFVGGDSHLYILPLNDREHEQNRLSSGRQRAEAPQWSPDGQMILFEGESPVFDTSGEQGYGTEIYVIEAQNGSVVDVSNDRAADTDPSWSPDGSEIAFVSTRGGNPDIYLMHADGSHVRRITNDPSKEAAPQWSPDGRALAFASDRSGQWQVYVMLTDGSEQKQLTFESTVSSREPEWMPQPCRQH